MMIVELESNMVWALRHEVMWPNKPLEYVKLDEDASGKHFGFFKDKELVAVVSLFFDGKKAQFRKLATRVSEQRKGYATALLEHVINHCKATEPEVEVLWCNSRKDKEGFYQKFGFLSMENTYSKGGIDFITMKKQLFPEAG